MNTHCPDNTNSHASIVASRLGTSVLVLATFCPAVCCEQVFGHLHAPIALPKGARLVFRDDFDRPRLDAWTAQNIRAETRAELNWRIRRGTWEIQTDAAGNRCLLGVGTPAEILLDKTLGSNFRLEYTAWSDNPGDRSALVCVPRPNFAFRDIYGFHFGASYSKRNLITRLRQMIGEPVTKPLPEPGRKHRVVIQKQDAQLSMFIDGKAVLSVKDDRYDAISGDLETIQGVRVGFYTYSEGIFYDDVSVFSLPGPKPEIIPADTTPDLHGGRGLPRNSRDNSRRTVGSRRGSVAALRSWTSRLLFTNRCRTGIGSSMICVSG